MSFLSKIFFLSLLVLVDIRDVQDTHRLIGYEVLSRSSEDFLHSRDGEEEERIRNLAKVERVKVEDERKTMFFIIPDKANKST